MKIDLGNNRLCPTCGGTGLAQYVGTPAGQCNKCIGAGMIEAVKSNSATLLGARATAITAMGELAQEFRRLGVYHYEEMVRGQQAAINGAVITIEEALERNT